METILGLLLLLIVLIGGACVFFLVFVQPIWGIVDVAVSKEHSGGTKAAVILLTLLLLGPIMTFFYACLGTRSRVLRNLTLVSFVVLVISVGSLIGLAVAVPMVKINCLGLPRVQNGKRSHGLRPGTMASPRSNRGEHRA
jgi:hypothetical protein